MSINKILIADDEPYVSRVLKIVLQQEGYEVVCVTNGKQAVDVYMSEQPDLVVTDVRMPHLTGRELVETIRYSKGDTDTPIIIMTSTLESENRNWVSDLENVVFLGKPVSPRNLVRVVNDFFTKSEASLFNKG